MPDIVVIGAGPAGLTAAIYARRAGRSVLVIEGQGVGGQIAYSPRVENYPGIKSISGAAFADALLEQALDLGAEITFASVTGLDGLSVVADGERISGRAVIIATGVRHRRLGLEREDSLRGISYCALCDGAFYRGKTVAVAGGGSTAVSSAALLSELCEKVYLIHRRDVFRAELSALEKLRARPNVEFAVPAVITALLGERDLSGLLLDTPAGARTLPVDGLFEAIGQIPQNEPFAASLRLDQNGYIVASEDCRTSAPHIYAAGDCRTKTVRQLTTAAADGSSAALSAIADM